MLTAEAQVQTERPSRYLVQLCRHASKMGQGRIHRIPAHAGDSQAPIDRPAHVEAEWSETHGTIRFDWGTCTVQATSEALAIRVEAADEKKLRGIQELITRNLIRFTKRDPVTVNWHRPEAPSDQPGEAGGAAPPPAGRSTPRRGRRQTITFTLIGALAIGLHLALAAGVLAAPQWTGWAADLVLAAVAVKVLLIVGHLYRRRKAARAR
jgi:hypothetical protein